uniref:C-type lectin domain-containing protein n=1 Tax=Esox lucius TaxID=8010 RepID=A0AAY5KXX9_ESOLU
MRLCSGSTLWSLFYNHLFRYFTYGCFTGPHRCPGEWRQFGSHCVIFDETPRSWAAAEVFHCQSLGGHLASALTFDLPLTWIGGTDSGQPEMTQDGRWSWSDGSKFNYKNWAKGKPENFDPARRPCIQMNYGGTKHRWNDATCGMKFPSLCSLRTE